jgi:hypothetical protein
MFRQSADSKEGAVKENFEARLHLSVLERDREFASRQREFRR